MESVSSWRGGDWDGGGDQVPVQRQDAPMLWWVPTEVAQFIQEGASLLGRSTRWRDV